MEPYRIPKNYSICFRMARNKRLSTPNNNVIVVCEGSTTEYEYFTDLKKYLVEHGIIRDYEIRIIPENRRIISHNSSRQSRHLMGNSQTWTYYEMQETDKSDYLKYRKQPLRYLREAQLFCDEGTYAEGWAIYDKDKHPALNEAEDFLVHDSRIHAAFSAYSFEEWLLLHFEYSTEKFSHSECKDSLGKEYQCGTLKDIKHDCKGKKCIGGALRYRGYIPQYAKNDKTLFSRFTLNPNGELNIVPFVNAARLRNFNEGKRRIDCASYTDVDICVLHLLRRDQIYKWVNYSQKFDVDGCSLVVLNKDNQIIIKNVSSKSFLLNAQHFNFCDDKYMPIDSLCITPVILRENEESALIPIHNYKFLMIKGVSNCTVVEL